MISPSFYCSLLKTQKPYQIRVFMLFLTLFILLFLEVNPVILDKNGKNK